MRVGIDLGGTKIEIIALGNDGSERLRRRVATPADEYGAILQAVVDLVASVEREVGTIDSIGVGTPGAISPSTGLLRNANTVALNGRPLDTDLARALGREVRIANDANCFALSEAVDGAGADAAVVFGVILGTGVGGGLVVGGRPVAGKNAIAGEWGHNPLPRMTDAERPGRPCHCGRRGCVETFLSGPGMRADHEAATGEVVEAREIARRADAGDAAALATVGRYHERLARSLSSVVNLIDPDVIVLGGGLSNIDSLYSEVPKLWPPHVFSDKIRTRLVQHAHGDSSGVRGAAWLWPRTAA